MTKRRGNIWLGVACVMALISLTVGAKDFLDGIRALSPWKVASGARFDANFKHWSGLALFLLLCVLPLAITSLIVLTRSFSSRGLAMVSGATSLILAIVGCTVVGLVVRLAVVEKLNPNYGVDPVDIQSLARFKGMTIGSPVVVLLNIGANDGVDGIAGGERGPGIEVKGRLGYLARGTLGLVVVRAGQEQRVFFAGRMIRDVRKSPDQEEKSTP